MLELGDLLSVSGGARAAGATRSGTKNPTEPKPDRTIADDDAAAAAIRNPLYAYQTQPDAHDAERNTFLNLSTEDTLAGVQKKVAEFKQLAEDIRGGRFSAKHIGNNLEADAEDIRNSADMTAGYVYSDVSELLARFREEVEKIKSFDGFLLGVYEKIEKFKPPAEFDLDQVQDVMQHMADVTSKLELGVFSLAHIREKALKALRCQDEPQPERVLKLLEDEAQKPHAGQPAVADAAATLQQNT